MTEIDYADGARTTTQMVYDLRGRLVNTQTFRSAPQWWTSGAPSASGAPPGYVPPSASDAVTQGILESRSVTYDEADNPVLVADGRTPSEWPVGSKPVTKRVTYDDAYRVTRVEYLNPAGASLTAGAPTTDTWVDPFAAEDANYSPRSPAAPTTTGNPRPMPHAVLPTRVAEERYAFDSLGNIVESRDDLEAFWDRSLGGQKMVDDKPYELEQASNELFTPASGRRGWLRAQYDEAGNLTAMVVRRTATMAPTGSSGWQRFAYGWDEVGRLMSASRWDLSSSRDYTSEREESARLENPPPTRTPDARMAYVYDGADERVVKTTTDMNNVARHTVDVFANYKLRLTTQTATAAGMDYALDASTERVELQSHGVTVGRVETMATSASTLTTPGQRTLLVLHDALGSAGIVLDRETGELAEAVTYTAYGQTESDLRPERFGSNREDERFTGKEEDVEIGLVYFGKRYLVPAMARWASADPLAVHAPGEADLNLYAYVHGRVYVAVDPLGLDAAGLKTAVANHDASGANTAMTDTSMADALNVLDHAKSGDVDWLYGATNDGPENRLSYAARTAATRLMPVVNDGNSTHGWGLEAGDQSAAGAYLAGKYIAAAGDKVTGLSRSRTGAALVALNNIGMNDPSHIAYAMATLRREASWGTSLEETPACRAGKAYEKSGYWGRGMIQVTHLAGYQSMSELLGTDLMGTNRDKLIHDVRLAADAFAVWWYNPACLAKKNIADWGLEGAFGKSARGTDARALVNAKDFDSMPEINAAAAAVRASMKPDATYWTRTQRGRL